MESSKESMKAHKEKVPSISTETIVYDADSVNKIFYVHTQKGKEYRVGHIWQPVSDERYFQYVVEAGRAAKQIERNQALETAFFEPNVKLFDEFVSDRIGFAENPDWKEKTAEFTKSNSTKKYFSAEVIEKDAIPAEESELLDDSEETFETYLNVVQNGVLIGTTHYWREETKDEMDEYLAILANAPRKNVLASAKKVTADERFCALYDSACVNQDGYKARVPAWHKHLMAKQFFEERFALLGK